MNNPFDYSPDEACERAFRELLARIDVLKQSSRAEDAKLCRELEAGKMLGVLIATDDGGRQHTLYAFSGQIGDAGFHHADFVEPVFDYLDYDGYFMTRGRAISRQNREIALFEAEELAEAAGKYEELRAKLNGEIESFREQCRQRKLARKLKRESGCVSDVEAAAMIRESQFEKAELRRLKKRATETLAPQESALKAAQERLAELKSKRRVDSEDLQQWLFDNFRLLNARGESRSLRDIFAETAMKIPPSGAGECCAPKLLQAAYRRGVHPVAIAEYWYGLPKGGELRVHGRHYPACRGKCLPVLRWMLQGLAVTPALGREYEIDNLPMPKIIYENEWFCIVDKPSGMLSVAGKRNGISVQQWLTERYGAERDVRAAHRLDQDTSGLLVATFGQQSYKMMQSLFARRKVEKTYIALLEGDYREKGLPRRGRISLPLSPDWLDRPRQRIDFEEGKEAVTDYEFESVADGCSRIIFHPRTGRTHQLRVHAASPEGLGMAIRGDRIYGTGGSSRMQRLYLHAHRLEFGYPGNGRHYVFESPLPF